jgi:hypothetical protein
LECGSLLPLYRRGAYAGDEKREQATALQANVPLPITLNYTFAFSSPIAEVHAVPGAPVEARPVYGGRRGDATWDGLILEQNAGAAIS